MTSGPTGQVVDAGHASLGIISLWPKMAPAEDDALIVKHSTASVFVLGEIAMQWRLGLVWHSRFGRWMLPGGHVESFENAAQAALREVREEAGLDVELLTAAGLAEPGGQATVPLPLWVVEQEVPPEGHRMPKPHVHVDHLFAARAHQARCPDSAELEFDWYAPTELPELEMFEESRRFALAVFANLDKLCPVGGTGS